jgi:hypothetical protein
VLLLDRILEIVMAAGAPLALPIAILTEAVFPFNLSPTFSGTLSMICGAVVIGFFAFGVFSFVDLFV